MTLAELIQQYATKIINNTNKKLALNKVVEEIGELVYETSKLPISTASKNYILKGLLEVLISQSEKEKSLKTERFSIDDYSDCVNAINSIISTQTNDQNSENKK